MTLHDALRESLRSVPDGVAAGYIDLATGSLLSVCAEDEKPQEFLNILASAVTELFEAPLFKVLDQIWSKDFTKDDLEKDALREVLLLGDQHITLLRRCEKNTKHAVVYVARNRTSPGVLIMQVRNQLPSVEAAT